MQTVPESSKCWRVYKHMAWLADGALPGSGDRVRSSEGM